MIIINNEGTEMVKNGEDWQTNDELGISRLIYLGIIEDCKLYQLAYRRVRKSHFCTYFNWLSCQSVTKQQKSFAYLSTGQTVSFRLPRKVRIWLNGGPGFEWRSWLDSSLLPGYPGRLVAVVVHGDFSRQFQSWADSLFGSTSGNRRCTI